MKLQRRINNLQPIISLNYPQFYAFYHGPDLMVSYQQNDYNDVIRRTTEDPDNAFPELQTKELKGLIAKESTFNSKAVSPTGRKGLVQMDENTAKSQGGLKFDGRNDPRLDPEKAIAAVPRILSKKCKYF